MTGREVGVDMEYVGEETLRHAANRKLGLRQKYILYMYKEICGRRWHADDIAELRNFLWLLQDFDQNFKFGDDTHCLYMFKAICKQEYRFDAMSYFLFLLQRFDSIFQFGDDFNRQTFVNKLVEKQDEIKMFYTQEYEDFEREYISNDKKEKIEEVSEIMRVRIR